jgi:hypothetical protein
LEKRAIVTLVLLRKRGRLRESPQADHSLKIKGDIQSDIATQRLGLSCAKTIIRQILKSIGCRSS